MVGLAIATILGVVEGVTEFLPVSSTGHLIVAGYLLGFVGDDASSFEVIIQLGAILSVVMLYWRRFIGLLPARLDRVRVGDSNLKGWPGIWRITVATLPALLVGYAARHVIKDELFNPTTVSIALAVGGVAILLIERYGPGRNTNALDRITLGQAFGVGVFQVLALWPGTSRAAATILGGMLLGLDRKSAAEFSFLIAVPVMFAATGYELVKSWHHMALQSSLQLGVGFVVAFIFALITVKIFINFLQRGSLTPFAWYRIVIAPIFYLLTRGLTF